MLHYVDDDGLDTGEGRDTKKQGELYLLSSFAFTGNVNLAKVSPAQGIQLFVTPIKEMIMFL